MESDADHLEGFEDLLQTSGSLFSTGLVSFRGLVKTIDPDEERYDLAPSEKDTVGVTAFRSEVPGDLLRVGASFNDSANHGYRVTRLRRSTNRALVKLECVVLHP